MGKRGPAKMVRSKAKAGRPSSYSDEIADEICSRLSEGETLFDICLEDRMPSRRTVNNWELANPDFFAKCRRAREAQGDHEHDQMALIERRVLAGEIAPQVASVVISSKQWRAAKLNRRRYADTKIIAGDTDNPVMIEHTNRLEIPTSMTIEEIEALQSALSATVARLEGPIIEGEAEEG